MTSNDRNDRRQFLRGVVGTGVAGLLFNRVGLAFAQDSLSPTPACDDGDEPTLAQTEGPYFTPNSPLRTNFREAGMAGTAIVLTGQVLTRSCRPVADVLVELWHADDAGRYDNEGFRLRGHQMTAQDGVYRFETIVPGIYTGRTRHFHVKYSGAEPAGADDAALFSRRARQRQRSNFSSRAAPGDQPVDRTCRAVRSGSRPGVSAISASRNLARRVSGSIR